MWKYKKRNKINYRRPKLMKYRKTVRHLRDYEYKKYIKKDKRTFKNQTILEKIIYEINKYF